MKRKNLFFRIAILMTVLMILTCIPYIQQQAYADSNRVLIYSSAEEYRNAHFQKRLNEQFPEYEIIIEYMPSGNQAAKIQAEGLETEADIIFDVDYGYMSLLEPYLADLSGYDQSVFVDDMKVESCRYLPQTRNGGAIVVNLDILVAEGLSLPASYEDLTQTEWYGLISMPNPKSSGTGYMFLKSLVNAWGEDEAFDYFDALAENILQFTSSGSGPVNALVQGEVAVGLGMTAQAVTAINEGANLQILYFAEGSPSSKYGYGMIEGKQNRQCVKEVFDFFYTTLVEEDKALFYPEQIYQDKVFSLPNYPQDIHYADMSNDTMEEKMRLLDNWEY